VALIVRFTLFQNGAESTVRKVSVNYKGRSGSGMAKMGSDIKFWRS
jgi:hypothetical protein